MYVPRPVAINNFEVVVLQKYDSHGNIEWTNNLTHNTMVEKWLHIIMNIVKITNKILLITSIECNLYKFINKYYH